jgi:hypothetical protein
VGTKYAPRTLCIDVSPSFGLCAPPPHVSQRGNWGKTMPIRPYLERGVFDQEDIQTMSMALEEVCRVLRIGVGAAREREVVAIRIIELARRGELEYRRLVERVLKEAGVDWARTSLGTAASPEGYLFGWRAASGGGRHEIVLRATGVIGTTCGSESRQRWDESCAPRVVERRARRADSRAPLAPARSTGAKAKETLARSPNSNDGISLTRMIPRCGSL